MFYSDKKDDAIIIIYQFSFKAFFIQGKKNFFEHYEVLFRLKKFFLIDHMSIILKNVLFLIQFQCLGKIKKIKNKHSKGLSLAISRT